jgi:hypothetical protein
MELNGYDLSRAWFNYCFANPEKISPNHTALYFFAIEHCNRLGWKEKFGLPTEMAKEAIGIKSYNTYINTLRDLVEWGFVIMVEKSKNQFSANIIALSKFDKAPDKALDKAMIKHVTKRCESTGESISSIDKHITINQEPLTNNETTPPPIEKSTHEVFAGKILENELDKENIEISARVKVTPELLKEYNAHLHNTSKHHSHYREYKNHLVNWIPKRPKTENKQTYERKANEQNPRLGRLDSKTVQSVLNRRKNSNPSQPDSGGEEAEWTQVDQ